MSNFVFCRLKLFKKRNIKSLEKSGLSVSLFNIDSYIFLLTRHYFLTFVLLCYFSGSAKKSLNKSQNTLYFKTDTALLIVFSKASFPYLSTSALLFSP